MGMCCSSMRYDQSSQYFKSNIRQAIEYDQSRKLTQILDQMRIVQDLSRSNSFSIDDPIAVFSSDKTKTLELNPLGYALWCRSKDCFKDLYEKHGASIQKMNILFLKSGKTPLSLICEKGFVDILTYFLPIYIHNKPSEEVEQSVYFNSSSEELSIFNEKTRSTRGLERGPSSILSYTPIQIAVEKGNFEVVKLLYDSFSEGTRLKEFDLNYRDEINGENCALIAVRIANLRMVQYLHQHTSADFLAMNKRNEDSLQIAAAWSKKKPNRDYLSMMKYLIEEVKIDISARYEEILLVCEDRSIIRYIEEVLKSKAIHITKSDIESRNKLVTAIRQRTEVEDYLDKLSGLSEFDFVELYYEFDKNKEETGSECSYSEVSSIPILTRNTTPMLSFISNLETVEENNLCK